MLVCEVKIKVAHHSNLPFTVIERVEKIWKLVQNHFVFTLVQFAMRNKQTKMSEILIYIVRTCLERFKSREEYQFYNYVFLQGLFHEKYKTTLTSVFPRK